MKFHLYPISMVLRHKWDQTGSPWLSGLDLGSKGKFSPHWTPVPWEGTKPFTGTITPRRVCIGITTTPWPWPESMSMLVSLAPTKSSILGSPPKNKTSWKYMVMLREDISQWLTDLLTKMEVSIILVKHCHQNSHPGLQVLVATLC